LCFSRTFLSVSQYDSGALLDEEIKMQSLRTIVTLLSLILLLSGYSFLGANWTPPISAPTADNVPPPINTGSDTQTKNGNFIANILIGSSEMRSPRYCDSAGSNCWNPASSSSSSIGGGDTLTVGGRCFAPAYEVTCNWNWSGDGNDNSSYIRPMGSDLGSACAAMGRAYQYHTVVLAECITRTYSWFQTSSRCSVEPPSDCRTAYGSIIRTYQCRDQFGTPSAENLCPQPKPPERSGSCSARSTGSSCR
jgi:hypothetical protein